MGRQYRLIRQEIAEIIKNGSFCSSKYFSLRYRDAKKGFKLAIITPKKVFKLAVRRNKTRRRFCSALRLALQELGATPALSAVFFLKQPCFSDPIDEIGHNLVSLLKKYK